MVFKIMNEGNTCFQHMKSVTRPKIYCGDLYGGMLAWLEKLYTTILYSTGMKVVVNATVGQL